MTDPRQLDRRQAPAQVVVPQRDAAGCNLRTRCRLTNLNTPLESVLREDSSFAISSRSFARAVSLFAIIVQSASAGGAGPVSSGESVSPDHLISSISGARWLQRAGRSMLMEVDERPRREQAGWVFARVARPG